mmetsp:Transcript_9534/g.11280  ORF Transcript_9534/g.11280 Transcript_9534/m.11280 type:complete len:84 (+) Transcript_9534:792-1043(+)
MMRRSRSGGNFMSLNKSESILSDSFKSTFKVNRLWKKSCRIYVYFLLKTEEVPSSGYDGFAAMGYFGLILFYCAISYRVVALI